MPDEPQVENVIASAKKSRGASAAGDVPEAIRRRYYVDERDGPGVGYYVDAQVKTAAFRDRGRELVAARLDPNAIRDMAAIAQHRGWTIVMARGSAEFRREAWIAGRTVGLEVRGYRPTERDLQELDRRQERRERTEDRREVPHEQRDARRNAVGDEREVRLEQREDRAAVAQLRVIDAVVRGRVADPKQQDRIIAAARDRVANWLERGARLEPLRGVDRSERSETTLVRNRQRSR